MTTGWSGGDRLQAYLEKTVTAVAKATEVRVGFLENATYPDGENVATVAAIQEFGAPGAGIPPRPFFRHMIAAKKAEWGPATAELLKANDYNAELTLNRMGAAIGGQLRQSIVDTVSPPLSPVTLMLREMRHKNPSLVVTAATVAEARARVKAGDSYSGASDKPLVDTGHMLQSVDYEVE